MQEYQVAEKIDEQGLIANLTKSEKYQFLSCKIVLWSLKSNMDQYPKILSKIQKIVASHPELDFYQDIKL